MALHLSHIEGGQNVYPSVFFANPRNEAIANGQQRRLSEPVVNPLTGVAYTVFFFVGLIVLGVFLSRLHSEVLLHSNGVQIVTAYVTGARTTAGDETEHYLTYEFPIGLGGAKQVSEHQVDERSYVTHPVGAPLRVRYSQRDPSTNEPISGKRNTPWRNMLLLLFGLGSLYVSVSEVLSAQRRLRLADALEERGVVLDGRLLCCEREEAGEGEPGYRCDYEVTPPQTDTVRGSLWIAAARFDEMAPPLRGTRVKIFYLDPDQHVML